ncbi:MAG TPA: zf-TFIIB domain-containing protein [Candidatus Polarisedimenticolia bacterium]|jgi:Zn-finger nucleic acid-binding protein|nr:zf-TFIIB domain-containing protein [Candidatus Polarisedimenticolia bacterium]
MKADSGDTSVFCSGCGGSMASIKYLTIPVDSCGDCGGTWLEEGRLKWIIEIGPKSLPTDRVKEMMTFSRAAPSYRLGDDETRRIVKCPYCIGIMRPVNYSANSGVAIYKCINDHGVWIPKDGIDRLVLFIDTWDRMLRENGPYYAHLAQLERKRFLRKLTL